MSRILARILSGLLLSAIALASMAQDRVAPEVGRAAATAKAPKAKPLVITPEREAAAMTFVQQHHPELAELLISLKESSPKEFERAVRDLYRTSERLAQTQERDMPTYDFELQLWKARSRAQLLTARLQMGDDEDLRQQLRESLAEEYDLRLQILQRERDKFAEKARGLDDQIGRLRQRRDEAIENQFKMMTHTARKAPASVKTSIRAKSSTGETKQPVAPKKK